MKTVLKLIMAMSLCLALVGCAKSSPEKKILIVMSSSDHVSLKGGKSHPTGYFFPEFIIPVEGLLKAGYKITVATPTGKIPVMDEASDSPEWFSSEDEYDEANKLLVSLPALINPVKLASLSSRALNSFRGVFIPGGHAPMEDLYKDRSLGKILRFFHKEGRPTALICHGPAALLSAKEESDWPYKGYKMTAFSDNEEKIGEEEGYLGGELTYYVASALSKAGGIIKNSDKPWQSNVVRDRELITGQNPMSTEAFTQAFLNALAK